MPTFSVMGLDKGDREASVVVSADDELSAREQASRKGIVPMTVSVISDSSGVRVQRRKGKLTDKQVWNFCERLAPMTEQNIPAGKCMEFMSQSAPDPELRALAYDIKEKLGGASLVDAICSTGKFPSLVEGCLRAGAESAKVDTILKMLSRFYEMKVTMFSSIMTALIQPGIAFIIIVCFVIFNFTFVAPQMCTVLKTMGHAPDGLLKMQWDVGIFMKSYWYILACGVIGMIVFFCIKSKARSNLVEWVISKVPAFRAVVYGLRQTAFAYCMSALSEAGMPYGKCFTYLIDISKDTPMEEQMRNASRYFEECGQFSTSLERHTKLDPEIIFQIKVGEKTATVPEQLLRVASVYEKTTAKAADALAAKITPIVIIVGAIMAVGSYLLPFFSLMSVCYKLMRGH